MFVFLLIIFSIPAVQTRAAKFLTESIRENSDVNLTVGRVSITYFGKVRLNDVYVEDHHQDILLNIEELRTSFLSLTSLRANTPDMGNTSAEGFTLKMRRYKGEDADNLSIILDKLRKEPTGEPKPFSLFVTDIDISDGYYSYVDENLEVPVIIEFEDLSFQAEDLRL